MRLVVTGGGTGGHIYPALAVAEAMKQDATILYLGKTGGLESELVPASDIPFEGIIFYGMPRSKNPLLPLKLLQWAWALYQAKEIAKQKLRQFKPDVVFGTGGYVSAPVLLAAKSLKIPYVLHEPDAEPGLANRFMAKGASIITTSFSEGVKALAHSKKQQVLVTGNPIRGEIGHFDRQQALQALGLSWPEDKTVLLVTGGSQGARRINQAVIEALPILLNDLDIAVLHLTGKKLYGEVLSALDEVDTTLRAHPFYWVQPYASQMPALLALADMALCRAGSLSLSEMYVSGLPTILVPYPYAAANHQRKNAMASVRAGASILIEDHDCTAEQLIIELKQLMQNVSQREMMQKAACNLGIHTQLRKLFVASSY